MAAEDGAVGLTSVKSNRLDTRRKRSQYTIEGNQGQDNPYDLLEDELNSNGILMESTPPVLDRFILSPEVVSVPPMEDPLPPMVYLMLLQKIKQSKNNC